MNTTLFESLMWLTLLAVFVLAIGTIIALALRLLRDTYQRDDSRSM